MDEKTYKWLTEAFESVTINEVSYLLFLVIKNLFFFFFL